MTARARVARWLAFATLCSLSYRAGAQESSSREEVPLEHCDVLPMVKVHAVGAEWRFLVDTGATTILNLKSFSSGVSKEIHIDSWKGRAGTSAREVTLAELQLGTHVLHDVKLPAIDLSPIGEACGGRVDGILGVDLLNRFGVTIDLKRQKALLEGAEIDARAQYDVMEKDMHPCLIAFNQGDAHVLEDCFDPEIVLYTPWGEFRGRSQVMKYMSDHFLKFAPNLSYISTPHDFRSFGDALWYSYQYKVIIPGQTLSGRGMAICRKQGGKWRILNMHDSMIQPEESAH
jgi:hypothetical protein